MSVFGDAWDWAKDAGEFVLDATEDVSDVLSDLGDALEDLGAIFGFGPKGNNVKDTPVSPTKPGTWPPWVWIGIAAVGVLVLWPRLRRAF